MGWGINLPLRQRRLLLREPSRAEGLRCFQIMGVIHRYPHLFVLCSSSAPSVAFASPRGFVASVLCKARLGARLSRARGAERSGAERVRSIGARSEAERGDP